MSGAANDPEMALLADLARLLNKYGQETFKSLADTLADREFSQRLSLMLTTLASVPRQSGSNAKRQQKDGRPDRLDQVASDLAAAGGGMEAALRPFVESMQMGEALPRVKDVNAFAERSGLRMPASRSRRDAVAELISRLMSLSLQEVQRLLPDLEASLQPRDRSLEGWNRIIERSREESSGGL